MVVKFPGIYFHWNIPRELWGSYFLINKTMKNCKKIREFYIVFNKTIENYKNEEVSRDYLVFLKIHCNYQFTMR